MNEHYNPEIVIETRNLSKRFKDVQAVDSLYMNVKRGEIYGFLGPNGAGKTTTIKMIMGLIRPTRGNIFLNGTWDLNGDGRMDIVDLGLEISDFFVGLPPAGIEPRVEYGLVIRTKDEKLELKSGLGFSPRTVQRIFESIARAGRAHPHMRVTDTRGQRREW